MRASTGDHLNAAYQEISTAGKRKAYRFNIGVLAPVLLFVAALLIPIFRSDMWSDFILGTSYKDRHYWPPQPHKIQDQRELEVRLLFGAAALLLGCFALLLAVQRKKTLQLLRDAEIGLDVPSALYLRPFFSDRTLGLPNPFYSYWAAAGNRSFEGWTLRPEEFVGRVLEPYINVRQVGGSEETIGNARIYVSDDAWQAAVQNAVQTAAVIVILPLVKQDAKLGRTLGEATVWELHHLVDTGRISQTIVIMPPAGWMKLRSVRRGWERTRTMASEFGLCLPGYDQRGGIFLFERKDNVWKVGRVFGQRLLSRKKLAAGLIQAFRHLAIKRSD